MTQIHGFLIYHDAFSFRFLVAAFLRFHQEITGILFMLMETMYNVRIIVNLYDIKDSSKNIKFFYNTQRSSVGRLLLWDAKHIISYNRTDNSFLLGDSQKLLH